MNALKKVLCGGLLVFTQCAYASLDAPEDLASATCTTPTSCVYMDGRAVPPKEMAKLKAALEDTTADTTQPDDEEEGK